MVPSSTFGPPATVIEVNVEREDGGGGSIIDDVHAMVENHTKMRRRCLRCSIRQEYGRHKSINHQHIRLQCPGFHVSVGFEGDGCDVCSYLRENSQ